MKYFKLYLADDISSMRLLALAVQIYLGLFLLVNVPVGWIIPLEDIGLPENGYRFIKSLWDLKFMMPTVKAIEFISAVCFLLNRKVFLGTLLMLPVLFNILGIGLFLFGSIRYSLPMALGFAFLSFTHREKFKALLQ